MDIMEKIIEITQKLYTLHLEDDCARDECWKKEIELFTRDLNTTIKCLDELDAKAFFYVTSVFDDISEHFKSKELIDCMKRNAKRTGVDCEVDIEFAIQALNYKN